MITDTGAGQTYYCPNCEDQARRIEELERRERMLVDALNHFAWMKFGVDWNIGTHAKHYRKKTEQFLKDDFDKIINATPAQSEAWEWNQHVEWMKKNLQVQATHCDVREERFFFEDDIKRLQRLPAGTQLVAIPELKEVKP